MKYSDLELEAIKLLWRKDKTAWCLTLNKNWEMWYAWFDNEWKIVHSKNDEMWGYSSQYWEHMWEILWHIPHSEDLFQKIKITPNLRCTFPNVWDKTYEVIIFNQHNPWEWVRVKMEIPLLDQPHLSEIISLFK